MRGHHGGAGSERAGLARGGSQLAEDGLNTPLADCLPASLRESPKGWGQGPVGLNSLRGVVSKKKRRFQKDGFDLDLSYITPQVIAMGFPSVGSEARYRNPMSQVQAFFQSYHKGHYKVYNLCCERSYDPSKFESATTFPFMDHNPPPILTLIDCVEDIFLFTDAHPRNVVAVHCKAGKGRTGLIVCCYLLRCGEHLAAEGAMRYYGIVRTSNGKGVTIQSQQRYIGYYEELVRHNVPRGILETPATRTLVGIRIRTTPIGGCQGIFIKIEQDVQCVGEKQSNRWKSTSHPGNSRRPSKEDASFVLDVRADLRVRGDILVQVCDKRPMLQKSKKLMHFWFNTFFIRDNYLCFTKKEIDDAHKDSTHQKFFSNLQVELFFSCEDQVARIKQISHWETASPPGGTLVNADQQRRRYEACVQDQNVSNLGSDRRQRSHELSELSLKTSAVPAQETRARPAGGSTIASSCPEDAVTAAMSSSLEGWLAKKRGMRWQLRHFVLQPQMGWLKYYSDDNATRQMVGLERTSTQVTRGTRGILLKDIDIASIQEYLDDESSSTVEHREFQFVYCGKVYMMRAKDEDKRDEWVAALRVAVQLSRDFTRPLQATPGGEVLLEDEQAAAALWGVPLRARPALGLPPKSNFSPSASGRSFPSDLPSQMGLASAMIAMQGYGPRELMVAQRELQTQFDQIRSSAPQPRAERTTSTASATTYRTSGSSICSFVSALDTQDDIYQDEGIQQTQHLTEQPKPMRITYDAAGHPTLVYE